MIEAVFTGFFLDRNAGPIADMLFGAGQRIK
jgi:hypothetical protein